MTKEYEKIDGDVYEIVKVKKSVSDLEYDIQTGLEHVARLQAELSDIQDVKEDVLK